MEKTREEMTQWIVKVAEANGFHCDVKPYEDGNSLDMRIKLNCALGTVAVIINVEDDFILTTGFTDVNIGQKIAEVGEFLMRANCDEFGHFYLNYDEPDVVSYSGCRLPYDCFKQDGDIVLLWYLPCLRFDTYGDGLVKVLLGCSTPKEAYEECVKSMNQAVKEQSEGETHQ